MDFTFVRKCFLLAAFLGLYGLALPSLAANIRSIAPFEEQSPGYLSPDSLCQEAASEDNPLHLRERHSVRGEKESSERRSINKDTQHLPFNFLHYLFYKFSVSDIFKTPSY